MNGYGEWIWGEGGEGMVNGDRTGQDRTGQVRTGQVRSGQVRTGGGGV